jgi:hypothetical protein
MKSVDRVIFVTDKRKDRSGMLVPGPTVQQLSKISPPMYVLNNISHNLASHTCLHTSLKFVRAAGSLSGINMHLLMTSALLHSLFEGWTHHPCRSGGAAQAYG